MGDWPATNCGWDQATGACHAIRYSPLIKSKEGKENICSAFCAKEVGVSLASSHVLSSVIVRRHLQIQTRNRFSMDPNRCISRGNYGQRGMQRASRKKKWQMRVGVRGLLSDLRSNGHVIDGVETREIP